MSELAGKTVGLYFSVQWFGKFRDFTEILAEIYNELLTKGEPFEIVFVGGDIDEGTCKLFFMQACHGWLCHLVIDL